MSIMIREYLGYDQFSVENSIGENINLSEGLNELDLIPSKSLMVDIEGIHVGPTRNFTRYMEQALKSSIPTWTAPYNKPLIMHHNEKDGKTIGRVQAASYITKSKLSGTGALLFTVNVPDEEGAKQVEDGRLLTVSIGVIAHDVRCSCCGHNIALHGECEHERGQVYDGEICYWDIYSMEAKELSYVIVPSDIYAKNVKIYKSKESKQHLSEGLITGGGNITMALTEAEIQALKDEVTSLKEANKTLETNLEAAKKELAEEKSKASAVSTELAEAQSTIDTLKSDLTDKETALTNETSLREAAEAQVIDLRSTSKQALIENLSTLRKVAGKKELEESSFAGRSEESLRDSIKDLQLELSESMDVTKIEKVDDPTLTESKKTDVNKEKKASNIDLEEGLQALFVGAAGRFGK